MSKYANQNIFQLHSGIQQLPFLLRQIIPVLAVLISSTSCTWTPRWDNVSSCFLSNTFQKLTTIHAYTSHWFHFCVLLSAAYLFACHAIYITLQFALYTNFLQLPFSKKFVTSAALPQYIPVSGTRKYWKIMCYLFRMRKHEALWHCCNSNLNNKKKKNQKTQTNQKTRTVSN